MSTALTFVPARAHSQQSHPESYLRVEGLLQFLDEHGVLSKLQLLDAKPAEGRLLAQAHTRGLLEEIRLACSRGIRNLDPDTYVTPESYELARLAAGASCVTTSAVLSGKADNGLAIVRPPGHHAARDRVGGFCLINNVAVASRFAQSTFGLQRILIVDFDVHHGNGTQDIFYDEAGVLFVSLHLFHPFFYPGTGSAGEIGKGDGRGYTVNVPFPPAVGDEGYQKAIEELVVPRAKEFKPEMIFVSAGFDAHWQDPLARALLSLEGYAGLCRQLVSLAGDLCENRIVFVLEGGYHHKALQFGLLNLADCLLGSDRILDPLGQAPEPERDVTNLLRDLCRLHLPN